MLLDFLLTINLFTMLFCSEYFCLHVFVFFHRYVGVTFGPNYKYSPDAYDRARQQMRVRALILDIYQF